MKKQDSKTKNQVSITTVRFPTALFKKLKMLAENDNRSFNNYVIRELEKLTKGIEK